MDDIDTSIILRYKFSMKTLSILILVVAMILLAACGNFPLTNDSVYTPGPGQPTFTPTPTPTPLPEDRPIAGDKFLLSGDYIAAYNEYYLGSTLANTPDLVASSMLGMGRALMLTKQFREAITQFSTLLSSYPSGEARNLAFYYIAQSYEAIDQPRLAADAYASFLEVMPSPLDSEILTLRADALMEAGDPVQAISAYETALQTASTTISEQVRLKLAQAYSASGDDSTAINLYLSIYDTSQNNYVRAQANLLLGQIYLRLGQPEQAYTRFNDSVENFPETYDAYSGLVALVEAGQPVNQRNRGIIDYNVGQFSVAIQALDQYLLENPDTHDGSAHYYRALSLYELGVYEEEVAEWNTLIRDHDNDEYYYPKAVVEKATTQWAQLQQFQEAAETCLTFVAKVPTSPQAAFFLVKAADIYEIGGYLTSAAQTYERIFVEYPGSAEAYPGMFKASILYYRLGEFNQAQVNFQRLIVLTDNPEEQAAANFWVAKSLEKQGQQAQASDYFNRAAQLDPTGYYSIRSQQLLTGTQPFSPPANIDLGVDFELEKVQADRWMENTFVLDASVDLAEGGDLPSNTSFQKAVLYHKLGMTDTARGEFEALRTELLGDAVNTYRLMNKLLELGYYRSATLASRHILDLAGLTETSNLTEPPVYFNHIRFGVFFREYVYSAAAEQSLEPLVVFSIIRQESLFESSIVSSVGARGVMQIMPATGDEIALNMGWPPNYQTSDLNRPYINITLGINYYKKWLNYFNGDHYAALASYNAGIGNAIAWMELAGGDQDLFLEIIRADQTKDYIKMITENFEIYQRIYTR